MKKFVRGICGRTLSMLVLTIFLIPSLLLPFTAKSLAAHDRQNILLLPFDAIVPDAPTSLAATVQQQVAAALMLRTGIQVDIFNKKSSAIRNVEQHLDEAGKEILRQSYETALNVNADPNQRFKAAAILGQLLGMDAVMYGTVDGYDIAGREGDKVRQIRLSGTAVTIDRGENADVMQEVNAERMLLSAKGFSRSMPNVHRTTAEMDIEAINSTAENFAYQYTGQTVSTVLTSPTDRPAAASGRKKNYTSWLFGGLAIAAIAMFANSSGSSEVTPPPAPDLPAPTSLQASTHFAGGNTLEVWLSWAITGTVTPTKINVYRTEDDGTTSRIVSINTTNTTKHAVARRSNDVTRSSGTTKKQAPTNIRQNRIMAAGITETRGVFGGLTRSFIDRPVAMNTVFLYEVEAVYGNVSVKSAALRVSTLPDLRAYNSGIDAQDIEGNVALNWDAAPGASFYRIYRSTTFDPAFGLATQDDLFRYFKPIADVTTLNYTDIITEYGKSYSYVIVPYYRANDPNTGPYQVDSVKPIRLLGVVTPSSYVHLKENVTLQIAALVMDQTGMPIADIPLTFIFQNQLPNGSTLERNDTTGDDGRATSDLKTGTTYGFGRVVVFWDKDGDGVLDISDDPAKNELVGRSGFIVIGLPRPTGLTAEILSNSEVRIAWDRSFFGPDNVEPDGYIVERRVDLAGNWSVISPLLANNVYIDTTVEVGKTYEYRVYTEMTAEEIESLPSNSASVKIEKAKPDTGTLTPTTATYRIIKPSTDFPITVNTVGVGGQAVGEGHNIRFILTKLYGAATASLDVTTKATDEFGSAQVILRSGADYGRVTVEAFYDKNGNGVLDPGESFGTTGTLIIGLVKPDILTATYNSGTGNVDLRWPQLGVNERYGDGFIIERQMEGDANWVKLPAVGVVNTPGVTVDLNAALNEYVYTDSHFLVPGKKYTYRIKTIVMETGIESATTSSQQILVPLLEPVSGVSEPVTPDYTIINPANPVPILVTALDKNNNPVGEGFIIKFRLTRDFQAVNAALSVPTAVRTNTDGQVTMTLTPGAGFGKVTVQAFYDKNGNNLIDAGEAMGTPVKLVLGLAKPEIFTAVYNEATSNVDLTWTALHVNEQYGDGFVIERQMEGDATWVRLPATGTVDVAGLTVNLSATSFVDNYNLQTGKNYTYRIKTVVVDRGLESATTSSLQILVPQLEPVSANIEPLTPDYTIINPANTVPISLTVLDRNGRPVGKDFIIKFRLIRDFQAVNAALSAPAAVRTNEDGEVSITLTPGAGFGKVTVKAFYDKNNNNLIDPGEQMGTDVKLVLGLVRPEIFTAVYNDVTNNVDLNWTALHVNEQYGDGFVIERQMEGDATWVRLPATGPVDVAGLTVNLSATSFVDNYNLQPGKKYTYRIKTVVIASGLESATSTSLQITVPQLEPVSANIEPVTPGYTIIDPAAAVPITLTVLDINGRPVGAGFVIKFRMTKDYQAVNAALSAAQATTNENGIVTVNLTPGAGFGKVTVKAFYDKNNNNIINAGEQMGTDVKLVLGLLKPDLLTATYNAAATRVDLSWPALDANALFGDGFVIERQMEGDAVWVKLPAVAGAIVGTTTPIDATSYADTYNLQFAKKYTYRIKNVVVVTGYETTTTTSNQVTLPDSPPDTTTTVIPSTITAVEVGAAVSTPITFMVRRANIAVGAGIPIMFKVRKVPTTMTSSLSVSEANTDNFGIVKVNLLSGTTLGHVFVEAYHDSNNNGVAEAGELLASTPMIIVGLMPPTNLVGSFNPMTAKPRLTWTAPAEGEGFIVQRRRVSPLPATEFADIATLPGLATTVWEDDMNPQPGHQYEYQVMTYWLTNNPVYSVPAGPVTVTLPSLTPRDGSFIPDVPVGENFIFVNQGAATAFTFLAKDLLGDPVSNADISFKAKIISGSAASVTVPDTPMKTGIDGTVNFNVTVANALVVFQLEAYFDTNGNGFYEPTEIIATSGRYTSGIRAATAATASGLIPASIKVSWAHNNAGLFADVFIIERSINDGPWEGVITQPINDPKEFTDVELNPGSTYKYRIFAANTQYGVRSNPAETNAVMPPADQVVDSLAVSLVTPGTGRIFFSEDSDDQLAVGLATRATLQITGTAGAKASAYANVSVTTSRGRFIAANPSQTLSNGNQTVNVTLDGAGKATLILLGRADNGVFDGFILPDANEFGKPSISASDINAKPLTISGGSNFLTIIGPANSVNVSTVMPPLGFDIPQYNEGINVIFQDKAGTLEVIARDANGEIVMPGMPIWVTQSWNVLQDKNNFNEFDYNRKSLGSSSIASHILLTDNAGKATTSISSNFSGLFNYRAFAVKKLTTNESNTLKNINTQVGGYTSADLPGISPLLITRSLVDTSPVTDETQVMHKTYVKYDAWQKSPNNWPNNLILCDGTVSATLTFIALDDNGKRVLPGTPYRVSGFLRGSGIDLSPEVELLQLNDIPITGQVLGFNDQAQAGLLVRGKGQIGELALLFDNNRTVGFTQYLTNHSRPGGVEAYATLYGQTITAGNTIVRYGEIAPYNFIAPDRLASTNAQADAITPRTTTYAIRFLNSSGQPIPAGYRVRLYSDNAAIPAMYRINEVDYTDSTGRVSFTYIAPPLSVIGQDMVVDNVKLELTGFDPSGPTAPITGWAVPSVTTEQPNNGILRINNGAVPANPYYPLGNEAYSLSVAVRNSNNVPTLEGFQIRRVVTLTGACNATVPAASVSTDAAGNVVFTMNGSTEYGTVRVQFFYDKNNSGAMNAGELLADTGVLTFGLATPSTPTATATSTAAGVTTTVRWADIQDEDGYLVYRDGVALELLGPDKTVNGQAGGMVTFVDNNRAGNTEYKYKVVAIRQNNIATAITVKSKESGELTFRTPPARPNPPTLSKTTDTTLRITWTGLPTDQQGTEYEIKRLMSNLATQFNTETAGDNALPPPGTTTATTFDDTSPILPGTTWVYSLRSRNDSGVSPWSAWSAPEEM